MAPTKDELSRISHQAEADLNSSQAKQGLKNTSVDDAGVDSNVEKRFPGAEVKYHPDISTNGGYNRRIPPEEGGELDDRGRQTRGQHFEGTGGPEHKLAQAQEDYGGHNDIDVVTSKALGRADIVGAGKDRKGNSVLEQGASASLNNVGSNPPGPGGSNYKGEEYYRPESVPDSIASEGYVPPESVTQASRETEY